MPLLLSESSLSLGYKPQLTSLTLFAFLQVSLDEYTGNHHTNTFFFDFRKWVISNLKDKLSIHKSS